jgi:trimeric autotransporter adhesin
MSTKTTFKRIALVAVASLGFGVLTSVAPANAAAGTSLAANNVTVVSITPFAVTTATGTAVTHAPTFAVATNGKVGDKIVFTVAVASAPVGSTATATLTAGTATAAREYSLAQGAQSTASTASVTATFSATAGTEALVGTAGNAIGTVSFTPDIPGEYQLTVTATSYAVAALTTAITNSGVGKLGVYASGVGASVASSGIGSLSAAAVTGGQARINFVPALGATPATALAANTSYTVTSSGVGSIINSTGSFAVLGTDGAGANHAQTNAGGSIATPSTGFAQPTSASAGYASGATLGTGSTTTPFEFIITTSSAVAGTQVLTFSEISATTGAPTLLGTQTIVWSSTASSASAALSSAFIGTGQAACSTSDATASALRFSSALGTAAANICVTLRDTNGVAINGQSLSVTVSGPGLVKIENNHSGTVAAGDARVAALTATDMASSNVAQIGINSDGTAGVSTITISQGTTVIATKTLTFYGDVATLTATQNYAIARSGITAATLATTATANLLGSTTSADTGLTVATAPAVTIVAKDAGGNVVPGVTVTAVIADATVLSSVEIAEAAGAASTIGAAGRGTFLAAVRSAIGGVSGKSTTVTFRTPNPAVPGAFITADPVTFTLGGTKTGGTVTMTTGKATYEPGERMVLTIKALDASGNKVYDGVATGTPSASKNVAGIAAGEFVNGEYILGDGATEFLYAPTVSGSFTLTLATGTATGATTTATATVGDDAATTAAAAAGDAAAEATDAANAATDAANAAAEAADAATAAAQDAADAVAALSTSVTAMVDSLRKQITSLTNLVIKIQRKVRA